MKKRICGLGLGLILLGVTCAHASVEDARSKGLKWLVQTQRGDGSFAGLKGLEVQATAASIEAMQAGGMAASASHARALSWLANAPGDSLDSRAWQTFALTQAGRDSQAIASIIRSQRNNATYIGGAPAPGVVSWGPAQGYMPSLPDTALGFGALRSAGDVSPSAPTDLVLSTLCYVLAAQQTGAPWTGSWPYSQSSVNQPAPTARGSLIATSIVLHELKIQSQANRFVSGSACGRTSPSAIISAIATAKTWLLSQANGNGGFAERHPVTGVLEPSNPVPTALALRALSLFAAEGDGPSVAAVNAARAWLVTEQNSDGSWRGDPFVTARVLAVLPAAAGTQLADNDNDGLPNVVEAQLGTQQGVADGQGVLAGNAGAQPGVTATSFSASGTLGQPFAFALSARGGSAPFTFVRVAGSLPQGISLAPNGQLTGTPTKEGVFAFDYQVTNASGAKTVVIGRIDIVSVSAGGSPNGGDSDAPLPAWALLLLGGALLGVMRKRRA